MSIKVIEDGNHEIEFQGKEYLLIGTLKDGAIATREDYENFNPSYAHLFSDGLIKRYFCVIGTVDDIKLKGKKNVQTPTD